jgi:hypothetical protein
VIEKRDFTADERREAARSGAAMPSGAFPIYNQEDLDNAVHLAGHAHDPGEAKRHIAARARELGLKNPYGKKKAKDYVTPAHAEADGRMNAKSTGNPVTNPYAPADARSRFDSSGGRGIAAGHPDLRESSTGVNPFSSYRNDRTAFLGQVAFTHPTMVTVSRLDTDSAGSFTPDIRRPGHPMRPASHTAPIGARSGDNPSDDPAAFSGNTPSRVVSHADHDPGMFSTPAHIPHSGMPAMSNAVTNKHAFLDAIREQARNAR